MLYLVLAIASSALVSLSIRASETHISNKYGMLMVNYIVCTLCSFVYMDKDMGIFLQDGFGFVTGLGIISGILYLATLLMMQYSTRHNGVVLSSTFMKLGVLIPTIMAIVVFREVPKATQVAGIALAVIAIVMIHFEKKAIHEGNKKIWLLWLLLGGGITDSMANVFGQYGKQVMKDGYLLLTFAVAAILAAVLAFREGKLSKEDFIYGMILGVPNYFSARFLLLALGDLSAVLVYPTFSAATLVVITTVGILVFKESVDKKKMAALGLIVLALFLLNI